MTSPARAARELMEQGYVGAALELIGRDWRFWLGTGLQAEGLAMTEAVLKAPGPKDARRVRVLYADGVLAFRAGDQERSRRSNEEALALARSLGDVRGECDALTGLARVALRDGRYDDVVRLAEEGGARAEAAGDRAARASPLHLQAAGVRLSGDYAAARDLYTQSLELNRELHDAGGVAMELHNLGWVELHLDHIEEAARLFGELERSAADDYVAAWRYLNRAALAAVRGDREEAGRMYVRGLKAVGELGAEPDPDDQFELDWLKQTLER